MADELRRDRVEVYKAILHDTSQMVARRELTTNIYVTLITSLLAADAFVAVNSQLDSWLPVFACATISVFGLQFVGQATRVSHDLSRALAFRYKWLENAERTPELAEVGANLFLEEYYDRHPASRSPDKPVAPNAGQAPNVPPAPSPTQPGPVLPDGRRGVRARGGTWSLFTFAFFAIPILLAVITALAGIPAFHPYIHPLLPPR